MNAENPVAHLIAFFTLCGLSAASAADYPLKPAHEVVDPKKDPLANRREKARLAEERLYGYGNGPRGPGLDVLDESSALGRPVEILR